MKLKVSKCKFSYEELKILGDIIGKYRPCPTDEELKAVKNCPSPTNINQLRSFLGLVNYLRKYIQHFCKFIFSLKELTERNFKTKIYKMNWKTNHKNPFKDLKKN